MSVNVQRNNFAAFESISNGKYNLGSVVLRKGGLSKINHHYHFTVLNGKTLSAQENNAVREQLYTAINDELMNKGIPDSQLEAIRKRLGLGDNGKVDPGADVGKTDLTRREIKLIINYVKQIQQGNKCFDELESENGDIKRKIAEAKLTEGQRFILRANLFGVNGKGGQFQQIKDSFNQLMNAKLLLGDAANEDWGDVANGISANEANNAKQSCLDFIDQFVQFCDEAQRQGANAFNKVSKTVKNHIAAFEKDLGDVAGFDDRKADINAKIADLQSYVGELEGQFKNDMDTFLSQLKFTDLAKGPNPAEGPDFANGKYSEYTNQISTKIIDIQAMIMLLTTDSLVLSNGHSEICNCINNATEALAKTAEYHKALQDIATNLKEDKRADERRDGEAVSDLLGKIDERHQKALKDKLSLCEDYQTNLKNYTCENIAEKKKDLRERLDAIVENETRDIDEMIAQANSKLTVTSLPGMDKDFDKARQLSETKRNNLTANLGKTWDAAKQDFEAHVTETVKQLDDLKWLSDELKNDVKNEFENLKRCFNDAARDTFVDKHPDGFPSPSDLLAQAKSNAAKIMENARKINDAACHKETQRRLDLIAKWVSGDTSQMDSMLKDFCELAKVDLFSNVTDLSTKHNLKLYLQYRFSSNITQLEEMARAMREGVLFRNAPMTADRLNEEIDSQIDQVQNIVSNAQIMGSLMDVEGIYRQHTAQFTTNSKALIGDAQKLKNEFQKNFNDLQEKDLATLANIIISSNNSSFARMLDGFKMMLISKYVTTKIGPRPNLDQQKDMASGMPKAFANLVERRKLLSLFTQKLARTQASFAQDHNGKPEYDQYNDQYKKLCKKFNEMELHFGQEQTLTAAALKKLIALKTPTPEGIQKILGDKSSYEFTLAEKLIVASNKSSIDPNLGAAPQPPALLDGIPVKGEDHAL